jgi:hypothetical protein
MRPFEALQAILSAAYALKASCIHSLEVAHSLKAAYTAERLCMHEALRACAGVYTARNMRQVDSLSICDLKTMYA